MARDLAPVPMTAFADVNPPTYLGGLLPSTEVSFIPMQDVSEGGEWTGQKVRRFGEVKVGYTTFVDGDVLFAKITPCMENGKGTHARGLVNGVGFGSTEFHVLRARGDNYDRFIYHWSQAPALRLKAQAFMIGSAGQQRVQPDFFDNFMVPDLPPTEQVRVAAVLDTLDEAIRRTEQVIAKLQQMKQGLLHDLLTRGVDENGDLRSPPDESPNLYKDSPVGPVPGRWDVVPLRSVLLGNPRNGLYKPPSAMGSGVLMIGQTAFTASRSLDFSLARRALITNAELRDFGIQQGDLLVTRVFATVDGVGLPVLVPDVPEPAVYESNMMRLKVDRRRVHPGVLFATLRSSRVRRFIVAGANSSNQTSINQAVLKSVPVAIPPVVEQDAVMTALDGADERRANESRLLDQLRAAKHGLLHDLLTGRVRVPMSAEVPA